MQQHAEMSSGQPVPVVDGTKAAGAAMPLRPALFARYEALDELRHDYPLVLVDAEDRAPLLRPLSRIIDDALSTAAARDASGEAMRQQVLRLEARIRKAVSAGKSDRLSELWRSCAAEMIAECGEAPFGPTDSNLDAARRRLGLDGVVIGCDEATPARVVSHVWSAKHKAKARRFRKKVEGLILRLTDILKSDHMKSHEAHSADALASAMGQDRDQSIDFSAMSGVLERARPEDRLPDDRVARIRNVLQVLQCQPFFGPGRASPACQKRGAPYSYIFDSCSEALDAHRDRLPEVLEFTKAITVAELEVENKYRPDLHDPIFERFDESDLTADQLELLPSALILLRDGVTTSAEIARAYEALACGLPLTVLIQVDDVLGPTSPEPPVNSFGAGTARLASMAMGLNNAFVLQATSAYLYRMQEAFVRSLRHEGPSLVAIYSGATRTAPGVPEYILAAAATESRAFPCFTYDPSAGPDLATRFDLSHNPQVGEDWPEHQLEFENAQGERQAQTLLFTFADFAICDRRYRRFCHTDAVQDRHSGTLPFRDWSRRASQSAGILAPYVLGVDPDNHLLRVVVDDKISDGACRSLDAWRRLQELAGINNSHARRLLAEERARREKEAAAAAADAPKSAAPVVVAAATAAAEVRKVEEAIEEAAPAATGDGPWIETARCTTCKECTQINSKLFAFDENMQAYIADPDAGTYRQIVEAAESCQVSIIHPGKPRNPDEPDLADLIERAAPFNQG